MIGGGPQKITVEIGGKIAASLSRSIKAAQIQVSSFGRNVSRTMNDAAIAGKKGFKGIFDNVLWQNAAVGAAGIGVALAGSVRAAAKFEQSLTDISKTAQLSQKDTKALGQEILRLTSRGETNQSAEQLAAGIKTLTGAGLGLEDAIKAIRGIGRVATATGSDITDVANTSYQLMQNLKIPAADVAGTFEILAAAGKKGSFELKDMATLLPTVASSANSLGVTGVKGAASLAAALQITRRGAGDASTAANNLVNLLQKIQSPDAVKNFKKFGVNIEQVTKNARAKGLNPLEETLKEVQRVTGGDQFKVSQIFGDMQVKNALMPLLRDFKDYIKIRDESLGAKNVIDEDYQKQIKTFSGTLASFQNVSQRLGITLGNALLPPLTSIAEALTPVAEGIAAFAQANPGLMTGIVAVGGALAGLVIALPIIAGVVGAIGTIGPPIVAGVGTLVTVIGTVIAVIGGPLTLAIVGVGLAIAAVIKFWPQISAAAKSAWAGVQAAWGRFSSWIGGVFNQALGVIRRWGPLVLGVMTNLPGTIINLFVRSQIGQRIITSIIDGLKAKAAGLFGWVTGAWAKIKGLVGGGGGGAPAPAGGTPPGRATGGRVRAGMPYVVGERRRELFVPGMDGAIIPRIARPAAGGNSISIDARGMTIHAAGDAQGIREQVRLAFEDLISRAYGDYRVALND